MNKRIKDPKGDLRFVHKSARPYSLRVLKLTAMILGTGCPEAKQVAAMLYA